MFGSTVISWKAIRGTPAKQKYLFQYGIEKKVNLMIGIKLIYGINSVCKESEGIEIAKIEESNKEE